MSIRKSIAFSFASKYMVIVLQFCSTMVLSRILTPADIGIYSVAYALVSLGHVFRDFGVGNYITQEKDLTTEKIRAAMALTLFFAWSVSMALYWGADLASDFYHEAGVKNVFQVLALNFLIIPFGCVTRSYIGRQMHFKFLMILSVTTTVVSTIVVIVLAYLNFSYMSMAWSSVAGVLYEIVVLQIFRPKELPYFPGIRKIKSVFSFGLMSFSESLLAQISSYFPDLLIGKLLNMHSVGILSRAYGTTAIFDRVISEGIGPVMLPYFSKEIREGAEIKPAYMHATYCLVGIAWPAYAFIAIMAEPIINVLYGSQWTESVVLLQVVCFSAAIGKLTGFAHPALMSQGRVKELLRLQLVLVPMHLIIMLSTINYGLVYMVATLSIGYSTLRLLMVMQVLNRIVAIKLTDYGKMMLGCLWPTLICCLAVLSIQYIFDLDYLRNLIVSSLVFCFIFLLSIFAFNHPLKPELLTIFVKAVQWVDIKLWRVNRL